MIILKRKVTICTCISRSFIDKEKVATLAAVLKENGYDISLEADLCKKIMNKSSDMEDIASGIIVACHPRAIRSHLHWLGLKAESVFNIRDNDVDEILTQIQIPEAKNTQGKEIYIEQINRFPAENGVDAWFPVLDKERCVECGKCHDFCLFGVYSIENKKVIVTQPQNCKNNCPACARMCPSRAIIFPKYEKSPINGGLAEEEQFDPQAMDALYKERLRSRLQQRRAGVPLIKQTNNK